MKGLGAKHGLGGNMPETLNIGLDAYRGIMGDEEINEIRRLGSFLKGAVFQNFNSTAVGGGVAEILVRLIPLLKDAGVDAIWDVIEGSSEFFQVTKAFHNALHGADEEITPEMLVTFQENQLANLDRVRADADFVAIHDPQPLGLVQRRQANSKWVWRCHIDMSEADPQVWGFMRPWVERYDAAMFHLPDYAKDLTIPQNIVPPAIDPLSDKNVELPSEEIRSVLERFEIDPKRPLVVQISRFDRLKDPIGVVKAFKMVQRWVPDAQLCLAGGGAADDPEGAVVLAEVQEIAGDDPDIHLLDLPPDSHRVINALQRAATVVVQKSIREGFGLVVTEAMWKGKAVVGGNVGGIRRQVLDGATGFLVQTPEGAAFRIRQLLLDRELAEQLGENARQHIRHNFLLPTYVKSWLLILLSLQHKGERRVRLGE